MKKQQKEIWMNYQGLEMRFNRSPVSWLSGVACLTSPCPYSAISQKGCDWSPPWGDGTPLASPVAQQEQTNKETP